MKKASSILDKLFGWMIMICLLMGGLAFFAFLVALIMGGGEGSAAEALANFIKSNYFPIIIRVASVTILVGLVSMYFKGESFLSLTTEKKSAEEELKSIKEEQASS